MCNDTEASLEADWEGYKSIWLSLNSPLCLKTLLCNRTDTTSRNRNTYRSCCNLSYAYVFTVTVGIITCVVEILAYDNIFI